jgi:ABC-type transporter Mla subunit MlaD
MAGSSKSAEIRAGLVVVGGIVILAIGLYLVSGGGDRFKDKNRLTIHFRDAGGIGGGADVYVAGQKAGEVKSLETVMFTHQGKRGRWVAVTIEIRKDLEIPIDSVFKISKSITNVVQFNVDYGSSNTLAKESTEGLVGRRLANVDELVDSYKELGAVAQDVAKNLDGLILDARAKVKDLDLQGLQGQARDLLTSLQDAAGEIRTLVRDNRARIDHLIGNLDDVTTSLKTDWGTMSGKVQGILDDAGEAVAEVKGILKENREGLKSIIQSLDDGMRRVGPVLAQIEAISRSANDAVIEMRPDLNRALAAASKAFENFQSLTEDLKAAPWKLINKPSGKESDDVHLYNAARLYVDAASEVADAVQDLETLRRLGVLGDAQRVDLLEKTLAAMQEALSEFDANQKRFTDLIEATSEGKK